MSAKISPCGTYRYTLERKVGNTGPGCAGSVLWIMLNPSTADASVDDPTIRKCVGFTRRWGFDRLTVLNLFALRSTDPRGLAADGDPVGPDNYQHLKSQFSMHDRVVFAWGAGVRHVKKKWVAEYVCTIYRDAVCLGTTKAGHPKHPLYIGYDVEPVPYGWARRCGAV